MEWNGRKTTFGGYTAPSGDWEEKEIFLVGTGDTVKLMFRESVNASSNTGSGPLLDGVVLRSVSASRYSRPLRTPENGAKLPISAKNNN